MKRYIHSKEEIEYIEVHFSDLFDSIAAIYYVDDLDTKEDIVGSSYYGDSYYRNCTDADLLSLSKAELNSIDDLEILYRLNQIDPNLLTLKQKRLLGNMYHLNLNNLSSGGIRILMDDTDVSNILQMLRQHQFVQGPYYRPQEPNKNFAIKHNLNIGPQDYAYIIHNLTVSEATVITPYKTFSYSDKNPGNELIVFDVDKMFTLANGQKLGNFKVYIKIDLTKTFEHKTDPIALISFHE